MPLCDVLKQIVLFHILAHGGAVEAELAGIVYTVGAIDLVLARLILGDAEGEGSVRRVPGA